MTEKLIISLININLLYLCAENRNKVNILFGIVFEYYGNGSYIIIRMTD